MPEEGATFWQGWQRRPLRSIEAQDGLDDGGAGFTPAAPVV